MSIKFGQIRNIMDHYTECCNNCDCGNYKDCGNSDCNTFIALLMRNEIMDLLDNAEVKTDALSMIPCSLNFKGRVKELPETAEEGDLYLVTLRHEQGFYCWEDTKSFYWYDNQWNFIPTNVPEPI